MTLRKTVNEFLHARMMLRTKLQIRIYASKNIHAWGAKDTEKMYKRLYTRVKDILKKCVEYYMHLRMSIRNISSNCDVSSIIFLIFNKRLLVCPKDIYLKNNLYIKHTPRELEPERSGAVLSLELEILIFPCSRSPFVF